MTVKNLKPIAIILILLCVALPLFAKDTTPAWVTDYKAEFPESQYLAQRGRGTDAATAKSDALFQLSTYISASVEANLTTTISSSVTNGVVSEHTDVSNIVSLSTSVSDLFALEFTDSYYVKKEKTWYAVAYIDRNTAFEQYQPIIEDVRAAFAADYALAKNEADPLTRCWYLTAAWDSGKEFLATLEYATLIHPTKAKQYNADRTTVMQIGSEINRNLKSCTYALAVEGDFENYITGAVTNALFATGMTESRMKPTYTVQVLINDNVSTGSKTVSITPSVTIAIINNATGESSYSFAYKAVEKETAYALDTAHKRCYPILAEALGTALSADLNQTFRL